MKISYNWLKEFIDLELSPAETAEKLTLIGLEVEELETYRSPLEGVIIGEIMHVSDHPNADRLRICRVNLGDDTVQIICGADNVAAGQKVPVATVGTTLPTPEGTKPFSIKKAMLRGEPSEGMICAEDELGLGTDHSGIMVLDKDLEVGAPLWEALNLYRDSIIDIAITPNRPDATCHLGVARDLAAALNLKLKKPFKTDFATAKPLKDFSIEIENTEKCHRYVGKIVEGVTIEESPHWLKNRLNTLGVRPVNNVVDVTNYVLLELGQPLHAFDKNQLKGNQIVVQNFDQEIEFETLDHVKRSCPAGTLFICDGDQPVAMAGVMGGLHSEVSDDTTDILIESAWFDPGSIRKTAKEQALQTDASYRFERGIDPKLQRIAAERAAELIAETAGGKIVDRCSDIHPVQHASKELSLRKSYTNRLLGTDFSIKEIVNLLDGLGLSIINKDAETVSYNIPSFRPDLQREVDLIEEVGRLFDYNNIPKPRHGSFSSPEPITEWEQLNAKIKTLAKGLGFKEIYTNSLMSQEDAERVGRTKKLMHTLNPISDDMTTLRPSLLHGFLQSAAYNFNRNASSVRFFETGHVFSKSKKGTYYEGIHEQASLLLGLAGLKTREHWSTKPQPYTIFDLKAIVNHFFESLNLQDHIATQKDGEDQLKYIVDEVEIGKAYAVSPSLLAGFDLNVPTFFAEFSITRLFEIIQTLPEESYRPVPKFPAFDFDFGVIVDTDIRAQALLATIKKTGGALLDTIDIFDVFEGQSLGRNKKSIAFRLSFIDENKTLTINDIEPIIEKILRALDDKYAAKLRQ